MILRGICEKMSWRVYFQFSKTLIGLMGRFFVLQSAFQVKNCLKYLSFVSKTLYVIDWQKWKLKYSRCSLFKRETGFKSKIFLLRRFLRFQFWEIWSWKIENRQNATFWASGWKTLRDTVQIFDGKFIYSQIPANVAFGLNIACPEAFYKAKSIFYVFRVKKLQKPSNWCVVLKTEKS